MARNAVHGVPGRDFCPSLLITMQIRRSPFFVRIGPARPASRGSRGSCGPVQELEVEFERPEAWRMAEAQASKVSSPYPSVQPTERDSAQAYQANREDPRATITAVPHRIARRAPPRGRVRSPRSTAIRAVTRKRRMTTPVKLTSSWGSSNTKALAVQGRRCPDWWTPGRTGESVQRTDEPTESFRADSEAYSHPAGRSMSGCTRHRIAIEVP